MLIYIENDYITIKNYVGRLLRIVVQVTKRSHSIQ